MNNPLISFFVFLEIEPKAGKKCQREGQICKSLTVFGDCCDGMECRWPKHGFLKIFKYCYKKEGSIDSFKHLILQFVIIIPLSHFITNIE